MTAAGLPDAGAYTSLALGDVNKDGFTDLFLGREGAPGLWAMSDGQERFRVTEGPPRSANTTAAGPAAIRRAAKSARLAAS